MIIPKKQTGTRKDSKGKDQPIWEPDLSGIDEAHVVSVSYRPETDDYEVTFSEKYERNLLKEENKALKAELKMQRDRIAEASDFNDLKAKIKKVKDSEEKPTKWRHKEDFLEGERIEHKRIQYISLRDHKADKDKEPPNELYRRLP